MLVVAVGVTIATTPLAKRVAIHFDAIDYPDQRRVNTQPTPRMGGIAMLCGIIASCFVIWFGVAWLGWANPFVEPTVGPVNYWLIGFGVLVMFVVGMVDDVVGLRARYKLLGQIVASALVSASGLLLYNIQNPIVDGAFIDFGWLAYPITILYLVCFANVINLIDGLDGLASGISAISGATIFAFCMFAGRVDAAILSVIIVGVCLGFLKSNHYPASIFMGDSGSLMLGISLGIISLLAVARSTLFISLLVPLLASGVPIMDTAAAIIRRKRAHQPIDVADKGHIHHRLLSAGYTQEFTVLIMWGWTAMLAVCGILLAESDGIARIAAIVIAAAVTAFSIYKLKLLDPVLRHYRNPRARRTPEQRAASRAANSQAFREGAPLSGARRNARMESAPGEKGPRSKNDSQSMRRTGNPRNSRSLRTDSGPATKRSSSRAGSSKPIRASKPSGKQSSAGSAPKPQTRRPSIHTRSDVRASNTGSFQKVDSGVGSNSRRIARPIPRNPRRK